MNRKTIAILATVLGAGLMTLAACSSDSSSATDGPKNNPPITNPDNKDGGNTNPDGGNTDPDGGEPETCTGSTFDNTRIPGWPTVPTP
ncbi:hypothetical protein [Labilithrix luteola]|nr:hypothetical protein [Labilithrix luteola]